MNLLKNALLNLAGILKAYMVRDVIMEYSYTTVICEVMPGKGRINYQKVAQIM